MEAVNSFASVLEGKLGVSAGIAQVLTWFAIFAIGWAIFQLIVPGAKGGALGGRRKKGDALLLLGQTGAGKTTFFFRLRDDVEVQTVSSLKTLRDKFTIKALENSPTLDVIDCPGHQRMRGRAAELLKEARCIVYLVDSEDKPRFKDVAEHLYELFTSPEVLELHTPILLALNKSDLPKARTEKYIIDELDREIEIMRGSRGATLEGQDSADSYLGVEGEKFKLLEHAPCPIQTCRVSVKQPALEPVLEYIRDQFGF
mmetsp:Transcript_33964/g.97842  ORF Transcript_33964/g.97842 Transcript_33964/m.97842 type:complete len:257 (-) Transcript_33964:109-879(-)